MRRDVPRTRPAARLLGMPLACLVVLLAGCTGAAEPAPMTSTVARPPTSATTSPAPSTTTPTPSTLTDDQQAIQAVERYYAAFNDALKTLRTSDLRKEFQTGCITCEQDADQIDLTARAGQTHIGGAARIEELRVIAKGKDESLLKGTISVEALAVKDASGKTIEQYPAATIQKSFTVGFAGGRWLVRGIT